jgi:hypothetical protein
MGDWQTDWNRDALLRIVALLFALAGLADLAADAPFLRRRRVLAILGHGEAVACAFLVATVTGAPVTVDEPGGACDAPRLAASFRALALALCALLARGAFSGRPGPARPQAQLGKASVSASLQAPPPALDTS